MKAIFAVSMFLLAACALWAQQQKAGTPPVRSEIRGAVLQSGTNLPVEDAEVLVFAQGPGPFRVNGGWKTDPVTKIKTDYRGRFTSSLDKPGPYRVSTKKEGYIAADPVEVSLTAVKPAAEVRLFMARPGRITGTVVDEDTGKPIANLRLGAMEAQYCTVFLRPERSVTTNAEGDFVISDLSPGDYAVQIGPQTEQEQRVLTQFTEKDAKAMDRDFERTCWPGGHGQESLVPAIVASNATAHIGLLPVKKGPYYRAHVLVPVSNCKPGDTMNIDESVEIFRGGWANHRLGKAPCDKDVLVTGFPTGSYRLIFSFEDRTASVPFSIMDKNIELIASLNPRVAVEGSFVAADGARAPDLSKVKVRLNSVDRVAFSEDLVEPTPVDVEGKFQIANVRPLGQSVFVSGLATGSYVKEIRCNGVPLVGGVVPLDDGASRHTLTIVVDDRTGTITGAVVSHDQPVSQPYVLARKWPPGSGPTPTSGMGRAMGDNSGHFQLTGLAPGEYRVIAVRAFSPSLAVNAAIERALAAGQRIEVGQNGIQNVTLELSELH